MKISELISQLHAIEDYHGDLEVEIARTMETDEIWSMDIRDVIVETSLNTVTKTRDHGKLIVVLDNYPPLP